MDFAAQLAQLERTANNARNNNNNNNSNNTNPNNNNNDYRKRNRSYEPNNNNQQQHQRNTRPRIDSSSYSSPRQQQQQQQQQNGYNRNNNNNYSGNDRRGNYDPSKSNRNNYNSYNNNNQHHRNNRSYSNNNNGMDTTSRSPEYQRQQRGNRNEMSSPQSSSSSYRPMNYNNNTPNNYKPAPLDTMVRYGFNVAPYPPDLTIPPYEATIRSTPATTIPSSQSASKPRSIPHLCLLAITIDNLPYEHIWDYWANNNNTINTNGCYISLVCHAKYPDKVTSDYIKRRLLLQPPTRGRGKNTLSDPIYHTRRPEWGSIDITRAMIDLVNDGMKIGTESNNSLSSSSTPVPLTSTAIELSIEALEELDPRYSTKRFLIARPQKKKQQQKRKPKKSINIPIVSNKNNNSDSDEDDDDDDEEGVSFINNSTSIKKREDDDDEDDDKDNSDNNSEDDEDDEQSGTDEAETTDDTLDVIPPADKFIFISETCVPVQTLQECCQALFPQTKENANGDDKDDSIVDSYVTFENSISWLNAFHRSYPGTPKNKYESDQFGEISRMIPGQYRWKADQWLVLSRIHANAIIRIDERIKPHHKLWNSFAKINASDEMYFPTALGLLGILEVDKNRTNSAKKDPPSSTTTAANGGQENAQPDVVEGNEGEEQESTTTTAPSSNDTNIRTKPIKVLNRPVTYTDWSEGMRNPASYTSGIRDFIKVAKKAREQGSLFARKFALWPLSASFNNNTKTTSNTSNEQAPGNITIEEWEETILKLKKE